MSASALRVLLVAALLAATWADDLPEGSKCETPSGALGLCKKLSACTSVRTDLRRKRPVVECSRIGSFPIVCCPVRKASRNRTAESEDGVSAPPSAADQPVNATTTPAPAAAQANITQIEVGSRLGTPPRTSRPAVGRIAREKCAEYSKYVYVEREALTLVGPPWMENTCATASAALIVGGEKAMEKEFPHMVRLGFEKAGGVEWSCGGSLIAPDFVLTAAHCLYSFETPVTWVLLGVLDSTTSPEVTQRIAVAERIQHPGYKPSVSGKYDDIALLRLRTPAQMTAHVRPACLHTEPILRTDTDSSNNPVATGWGLTNESDPSDHLLKVSLKVSENRECRRWYGISRHIQDGIRQESQVCAGDLGHDSCQGDSGGPLQLVTSASEPYCMYKLAGVVSFGPAGCGYGQPGVYTRVYHYVPWIESIVWPERKAAPVRTTPPTAPLVSSQPSRPGWGQAWGFPGPANAPAQGQRQKPVPDVDMKGDADMVFPAAQGPHEPAQRPRVTTTWKPAAWTQTFPFQESDNAFLFPGDDPQPPQRKRSSGATQPEYSVWTIR